MKIVSLAPGRVCLFGDHQDYLGLPVIACSIDRYIELNAIPNNEYLFRIDLPDIGNDYELSIDDPILTLNKRDYFASSLRVIKKYGFQVQQGFDIQITGNIPINAGLSSSSAMIVAWIQFLIYASGANDISQSQVAKLAYEAEVVEHGESGGMMDQYTIALGNIQHIYLENDFAHEQIGSSLKCLIVGESGIPKDTVGLLKDKKINALRSIDIIKRKYPNFNIKNVNSKTYKSFENYLSNDLKTYFYAAVQNYLITQEALDEFSKTELKEKKIGQLMFKHNTILKENLKITVPLIDDMINAAVNSGAYGAKIVGSGGGGSIVAFTDETKKQAVLNSIKAAGAKDAYEVKVVKGAYITNKKN